MGPTSSFKGRRCTSPGFDTGSTVPMMEPFPTSGAAGIDGLDPEEFITNIAGFGRIAARCEHAVLFKRFGVG